MKNRKSIAKLVTILCAAIFIFGCTTTVFGANDIVGRATGNGSSSSSRTTRTSSSSSSSATYNGSGSTTKVTNGAETTGYVSSVATSTQTKGAAVTVPTTTRVNSQVQTGVMERILPFVLVISASLLVFWLFFHLQMNQVRYGKSEKYYKELLDFKVMCKI